MSVVSVVKRVQRHIQSSLGPLQPIRIKPILRNLLSGLNETTLKTNFEEEQENKACKLQVHRLYTKVWHTCMSNGSPWGS